MKRTVTAEAKRKLHDTLIAIEGVHIADTFALSRAVEAIVEWYEEQNTFTDNITTEEKTCPLCGALWVISKRYLPRYLVKPLRILSNAGRAMTTKELWEATGNRQVYTKFSWLQHWGLTTKVGSSLYSITDKGHRFLLGEVTVPEFLWMLKNKVVPTPEGHEHPVNVFFYQLAAGDTDDRAEHVERAAPVSATL